MWRGRKEPIGLCVMRVEFGEVAHLLEVSLHVDQHPLYGRPDGVEEPQREEMTSESWPWTASPPWTTGNGTSDQMGFVTPALTPHVGSPESISAPTT
ncbi:hypothetical protein TB2_009050 [Malus domestica]